MTKLKSVFNSLEKEVLQKFQICFATTKKEMSFQTKKSNCAESWYTTVECHTSWKKFFVQVGVENPGPTIYQEITDRFNNII